MTDEADAAGPKLTVASLVGDEVTKVAAHTPLAEVAAILHDGGIGAVVVGEGDKPEGIVTERDIVTAMARGLDPGSTTAGETATRSLQWVDADATVDEVANEMMQNWIRHVLVESDGALIGIVSLRDLVAYYVSAFDAPD